MFSFDCLLIANNKVANAESDSTKNKQESGEELKLNEPITVNNTKVELLDSSYDYQKVKITNLGDNSVEFIESFKKNGEEYIETHSENESFRIDVEKEENLDIKPDLTTKNNLSLKENVNPEITITNLKTNKKEKLKIKEEFNQDNYTTFNATDGFSYLKSSQGSAALNRTTKSLVIGTIATLAGVHPGLSIVISIGTYLYDINAPHVYWMKGHWIKSIDIWTVRYRDITSFFRYHDYTGFIESAITREWDYTQT